MKQNDELLERYAQKLAGIEVDTLSCSQSVISEIAKAGLTVLYGAGPSLLVMDGCLMHLIPVADKPHDIRIGIDEQGEVISTEDIIYNDMLPNIPSKSFSADGIIRRVLSAEVEKMKHQITARSVVSESGTMWEFETSIPCKRFVVVENGQPCANALVFETTSIFNGGKD